MNDYTRKIIIFANRQPASCHHYDCSTCFKPFLHTAIRSTLIVSYKIMINLTFVFPLFTITGIFRHYTPPLSQG